MTIDDEGSGTSKRPGPDDAKKPGCKGPPALVAIMSQAPATGAVRRRRAAGGELRMNDPTGSPRADHEERQEPAVREATATLQRMLGSKALDPQVRARYGQSAVLFDALVQRSAEATKLFDEEEELRAQLEKDQDSEDLRNRLAAKSDELARVLTERNQLLVALKAAGATADKNSRDHLARNAREE